MDPIKFRGLITAILSGSIASGLNKLFLYLGFSNLFSAAIGLYLIGNILAYSFDILFAKKEFFVNNAYKTIPYTNFSIRIIWLLKSFFSATFFKFVITVLIDILIGLTILKKLTKYLDKKNIHFKFRDIILSISIATFTFFLYVNILRFDWAYNENADPIFTLIVSMWLSIVMMIYVLNM